MMIAEMMCVAFGKDVTMEAPKLFQHCDLGAEIRVRGPNFMGSRHASSLGAAVSETRESAASFQVQTACAGLSTAALSLKESWGSSLS